MKMNGFVAAALMVVLAGCSSTPGGSPRCSGATLNVGPADRDLDGNPDGIGITIDFPFVTACVIPGAAFSGYVHTIQSGSSRKYEIEMLTGPAAGKKYTANHIYDAISVMDQVFSANGYDMSYTETSAYRNSWKDWLLSNFMSPSSFYATYGY